MSSRPKNPARPAAPDPWILWIATVLLGFGAVMVLSASSHLAAENYDTPLRFFLKQALFFVVGLGVLVGVSRVPFSFWKKSYRIWLLVALALLVVVLFAPPVRGARRWLSFGPFGLQPSEAYRFCTILFLAAVLSRRRRGGPTFRTSVLPGLVVLGAGSVLLMLQPDFGSVLLLAGTVLTMLFLSGTRWKHLFWITLPAVAMAVLLVFGFGYKRDRLAHFVEGLRDPFAAGYQVRQGIIHMGAGGWTGKGLGGGMSKFLYVPDAHTDFILASAGEELGVLVSLALLTAYAFLFLRCFRIATRAPDRYSALLVGGLAASLGFQTAINIGVVLGLVPPTGLPLPLISYGGTSVLFTTAALAVILNVSRHVQD